MFLSKIPDCLFFSDHTVRSAELSLWKSVYIIVKVKDEGAFRPAKVFGRYHLNSEYN